MKPETSQILQTIYRFYPKHISYNRKKGKSYKKTKEFKAFIKKRKKAMKNHQQIEIFREELQNLLRLEVVNFSNLKNDVSYRYHCLLQDCDKGKTLELVVVISYLDLYYCYFFIESAKNSFQDSLESAEIQKKYQKIYQEKLKKLDLFFLQKGYCRVKNPMDSVDCIETELKNQGEVNVYDCLFSDLFR